MKIGLGTVQFGMDYGVSNPVGKTPLYEADAILQYAAECGISVLDTAALYGESEEVLGALLPSSHSFQIVTKTLKFGECGDTKAMLSRFEATLRLSLQKLRQNSIYGLLFHDANDLLGDQGKHLADKATELKHTGYVKKIGVSVYSGDQIDSILERFPIDLIQIPLNVFDQRLLASGHLQELKRAGVEIHVRSAFLQGLLLMNPDKIPPYFEPISNHLQAYWQDIAQQGLTPVQAALGFVIGQPEVDKVILGVNTCQQLREIVAVTTCPVSTAGFGKFALADENMINPGKWRM